MSMLAYDVWRLILLRWSLTSSKSFPRVESLGPPNPAGTRVQAGSSASRKNTPKAIRSRPGKPYGSTGNAVWPCACIMRCRTLSKVDKQMIKRNSEIGTTDWDKYWMEHPITQHYEFYPNEMAVYRRLSVDGHMYHDHTLVAACASIESAEAAFRLLRGYVIPCLLEDAYLPEPTSPPVVVPQVHDS